jgi:hypothetical protein
MSRLVLEGAASGIVDISKRHRLTFCLQVRIEERHRKDEIATPDVIHSPSHHQDKERDKATNLDLFNIRHGSRKSTGGCMTFWRLFTHLEMGIAFVCLDHSKMRREKLLLCLAARIFCCPTQPDSLLKSEVDISAPICKILPASWQATKIVTDQFSLTFDLPSFLPSCLLVQKGLIPGFEVSRPFIPHHLLMSRPPSALLLEYCSLQPYSIAFRDNASSASSASVEMGGSIASTKMVKAVIRFSHPHQLFPQVQLPSSQSPQLFQAGSATLQSIATVFFPS